MTLLALASDPPSPVISPCNIFLLQARDAEFDKGGVSVYVARAGWRVPCVFITLAGFG